MARVGQLDRLNTGKPKVSGNDRQAAGVRTHDDFVRRPALLQKSWSGRSLPFPLWGQAARTLSAVRRALKRFMTEQVNATGSREPAKDADVDFGGLAVRIS